MINIINNVYKLITITSLTPWGSYSPIALPIVYDYAPSQPCGIWFSIEWLCRSHWLNRILFKYCTETYHFCYINFTLTLRVCNNVAIPNSQLKIFKKHKYFMTTRSPLAYEHMEVKLMRMRTHYFYKNTPQHCFMK